MCNCHVLKHAVDDFCTLLVFRSTAAVLCNYNDELYTFVASMLVIDTDMPSMTS